MCMSVPGRIIEILGSDPQMARVDITGLERLVNLGLLDKGEIFTGAWVLVQAGLAVASVSAEEAKEMIDLIEELDQVYREEFS